MDYEYKDQNFSVEIAEALIPERNSTGVKIKTVEDRVLGSHTTRWIRSSRRRIQSYDHPEGTAKLEFCRKGERGLPI